MASENKTFLYFTYGTLMKGERNEHLLKTARYIGRAMTKPKYKLFRIDGNFTFPAIIDEGKVAVVGELYEVPIEALPGMDRMEGHPHFYRRQPIELDTLMLEDVDSTTDAQREAFIDAADGKEVIAYFFVNKKELVYYPEIKSGNWRKQ